jgi:hypothetical protein
MTTITMRYTKGAFLVTGKDIMGADIRLTSRSQGLVRWSFPGAPIKEIAGAPRSRQRENRGCSAMTRLEQRGGVAFAVVISSRW